MLKLDWARVAAWRAHRHHLDKRSAVGSMLAVASRLCGFHAQLMSSAELMAWARVEALDRQEVQRALWNERTLVKTWAMRGTLHLLPTTELHVWHSALGISPRYLKENQWQKHFGITLEELDDLTQAIGIALKDRVLTREDLAKEVERMTGSSAFGSKLGLSGWGVILKPAAFAGHLCFGPSQGQRVRFTRPDSWVKKKLPPVSTRDAIKVITRQYLSAYEPASYRDLARWWSGGGVTEARKWIALLEDEVSPVDIEGVTHWVLSSHLRKLRTFEVTKSVRLLPGFDQYVIGASYHAQHLLAGGARQRVYRPQGWISPVLLVNGRMEGVWRHRVKGRRLEVTIEPFAKTPAWVRKGAQLEAERLAAFLDRSLSLDWK